MIKFYSSHCPKCIVLKNIMDSKKIKYDEIVEEDIYMPIARKNKIFSMPFAEVDGKILDTKQLQEFIMEE